MKTAKEWASIIIWNDDTYENIISEIQKEAYNQAIRDAAENARTEKIGNSGSWYDAGINEGSILKLLK